MRWTRTCRSRTRAIDLPFLMPIEDIFSISGRGTVVTGRIERGKVKVGEDVRDRRLPRDAARRLSRALKCSRSSWTKVWRATTPVFFCAVSPKEDVERGMVLAKPGSITPHTMFKGRGLRAVEGRRWPSHSVLQRLPSPVLLPHDGRDGHRRSFRKARRW